MGGGWTLENDLKLLFTILETTNVKPAWSSVAKTMGEGFTAEAVRQHFAKLKKTGGKSGLATDSPGKSPASVRSRKRQRSVDSDESVSIAKKPFRPRKLFQGANQVGNATTGMSSLQVVSPRTRSKASKKAPLAENVELLEKAKKDRGESGEDAGESGNDEANEGSI